MILGFGFIIIRYIKSKTTLNGETLYKSVITERIFSLIGLIITIGVLVIVFVSNVIDYNYIKNNYEDGNFNIISCTIEDFISMEIDGHSQEVL